MSQEEIEQEIETVQDEINMLTLQLNFMSKLTNYNLYQDSRVNYPIQLESLLNHDPDSIELQTKIDALQFLLERLKSIQHTNE